MNKNDLNLSSYNGIDDLNNFTKGLVEYFENKLKCCWIHTDFIFNG